MLTLFYYRFNATESGFSSRTLDQLGPSVTRMNGSRPFLFPAFLHPDSTVSALSPSCSPCQQARVPDYTGLGWSRTLRSCSDFTVSTEGGVGSSGPAPQTLTHSEPSRQLLTSQPNIRKHELPRVKHLKFAEGDTVIWRKTHLYPSSFPFQTSCPKSQNFYFTGFLFYPIANSFRNPGRVDIFYCFKVLKLRNGHKTSSFNRE